MQYLLLIYANESESASRFGDPDARSDYLTAFGSYTESLAESGKMLGGEALHGVSSATTVRVRDGRTLTADGPFAETKEQLGGFYFVEAEDLDDAIAWASKIPTAEFGSIEVRPILNWEAGETWEPS